MKMQGTENWSLAQGLRFDGRCSTLCHIVIGVLTHDRRIASAPKTSDKNGRLAIFPCGKAIHPASSSSTKILVNYITFT